MRIAVASTGMDVAPRFECAESFTCYTVVRGIITRCQNIPKPKLGYEGLVRLLEEIDVTTLIVGAIPLDVANHFCNADIEVVAGATGSAKSVAEQYLANTLYDVEMPCHYE